MKIRSRPGLLSAYRSCSKNVRDYFEHLPDLVNGFPLDVCLAYAFSRLETAQTMALYCGVVKVYRANRDVARNALDATHITRKSFADLYETAFGLAVPDAAARGLKTAEATRDSVMHGKGATEDRIRNALARVLEYAEAVNKQLGEEHGLRPFGDLRGFAGAAKKHDKRTTRFILKGMGFSLS